MAAKIHTLDFKLGGTVSQKFTGSVLNASKTVGMLGQKIVSLEEARGKTNQFDALKKDLVDIGHKFKKAEEESRQLASEIALTARHAQKLGDQFEAADSKTKKLGASLGSQKTALAKLKHEMASANEKVQATKAEFSEAREATQRLAAEIAGATKPTKELQGQFDAAKHKVQILKTSLDNQKTSLAKLKHEMTSTGEKVQATQVEFSEAREASKRLASELAATARPAKLLQTRFEEANRKTKGLRASIREQGKSLGTLKRELSAAGLKTQALAKHNEDLAKAIDFARRKEEKLQSIMMKQKKLRGQRGEMQGKLFDAAAIGAAVAFPTMIAARFEQSMAEVKSLTGATGKDFEALTAKARMLGSTTSFSASEAAQGMKYLGMAGFSTTQIIAAMPGVLNMAKAGAVDLGLASDIASDIMSGFGLKASEMGRVSDVLTKTFTTSNTSLEMLGETMKYVAPVASKAGMSLEETAAMAGLLGNVGIKASMAGTTLKSMVLGLAAPTSAAATAMENLRIKTADAQGNMRPMTEILGDMSKATKDMGNAEKLDLVKTIFGVEAAAGLTELLSKAGEDGIEAYVKKVRESKGAAETISKVMDNTTIGALKGLGSAAEGLAIVFGNTLTPMITATAHGLAFITRGVTAAAEKFPIMTKAVGLLVGGTVALTTTVIAAGYAWSFAATGIAKTQEMYTLVSMRLKGVTIRTLAHSAAQKVATVTTRAMALATAGAAHASAISSAGLLKAQAMYQKISLVMRGVTVRTIAFSAVQKITAAATWVMTSAQWALNAAMSANPIGWIVITVAALAAGAVALYRNFKPFTVLVDNTWALIKSFGGGVWSGLVAGLTPVIAVFTEIKTAVGTIFSSIGEIIIPIKDAFASLFTPLTGWFAGLLGPIDSSGKAMSGFAAVGKVVGKTLGFVLKTALFPLLTTIKAIAAATKVASKIAQFFSGNKPGEKAGPKTLKTTKAANADVIKFRANSKVAPIAQKIPPTQSAKIIPLVAQPKVTVLKPDIASDIMSGFGLEASEMGRVSDVLTKTFTTSNTSLEMLGETMKYVAPVASKAGMALEETAAMAGLLGNVGIKASMAGTTLKGMVQGLASPSTEAATALENLGIKTADAQGNMRPVTEILGDLSKATKDMGNAKKLDIVTTIFGKVSAAGLTELLGQAGEDGIEAYIKKIRESKGAAETISKAKTIKTTKAASADVIKFRANSKVAPIAQKIPPTQSAKITPLVAQPKVTVLKAQQGHAKAQELSRAVNAEVVKLQSAGSAETRQGLPEVKQAPTGPNTSIEYKPQITIATTGSNVAAFKAAADQSLMESETRFRKMQAEVNHDDRRRAFG